MWSIIKKTKSQNIFKKIKSDLGKKKERQKALSFLILFLIFFFIIYLLLTKTFLYKQINIFFAVTSGFILQTIFGINNHFIYDSFLKSSTIIISNLEYPLIINKLCTGILEFSLLSAAIIASKGISILKRIIGFLISILVVIVFNIFRISFTGYLIINLNLFWAEIFHGILFRLFLVIIVIGTYYLWLKKNMMCD